MKKQYRVSVPALPVRSEASDRAEMANQLLFGEGLVIEQKDKQWLQIKSLHDDYVGWVDEKGICGSTMTPAFMVCSPVLMAKTKEGSPLILSGGSRVDGFDERQKRFEANGKHYEISYGCLKPTNQPLTKEEGMRLALDYRNVPYLWGGRSALGIDCSGFTQVIYGMMGLALPRDASQQVNKGHEVAFVQDVQPGDLAFFGNVENRIIHVGILLDKQTILHASGKVRVDSFDQQGIFNKENQEYTHRLRVIKRL